MKKTLWRSQGPLPGQYLSETPSKCVYCKSLIEEGDQCDIMIIDDDTWTGMPTGNLCYVCYSCMIITNRDEKIDSILDKK